MLFWLVKTPISNRSKSNRFLNEWEANPNSPVIQILSYLTPRMGIREVYLLYVRTMDRDRNPYN